MNDIAKGVLGSLIAAALIAAGGWLSTVMVKEEVALFLRVNQKSLGSLVVWDLKFSNYNEYALDDVKINIPTQSIIDVQFDSESGVNKTEGAESYFWEGELEKHGAINVLAVFNSPNMVYSAERFNEVATAKYRIRDDNTGVLKWQAIPVLQGTEPTTSRTVLKIFWFLLPICLAAIASFCWLAISRHFKNNKPNRERSSFGVDTEAEQGAQEGQPPSSAAS